MAQLIEFTMEHWVLVGLFFAVLAMLIGGEVSRKLSGAVQISALEATQKLNHEKAVLLDIRETKEFNQEHIINARNIPQGELDKRVDEIADWRDVPVIVYCANGHRSMNACAKLHKQGFKSIFNLSGGINAWLGANLPIAKGSS